MEELKTLKDLSALKKYVGDVEVGIKEYSNIVYVDELKAEAVKWEKKEQSEDVILWIIDFFNLTEEDLKEEIKE